MVTTEINQFSPVLKKLLEKNALKPGEVALFKILRSPTVMELVDEKNRSNKIERLPHCISLKRQTTIIDPGTGMPVRIANLVGYRPSTIAGQPQEPIIKELEFLNTNNGFIRIPATNPVALQRLLLDDKNKDCINPSHRPPASGYLFERVRPELTAKEEWEKLNSRLEAQAAIKEMEDDEQLILSTCKKLTLPLEENARLLTQYELLMRLTLLANQDPQRVLSVIDSGEMKLEKLLAQAVAAEIIVANTELGEWRMVTSQEKITPFLQGYAPEAALVKYIQTHANGPAFSQMLAKQVEAATAKK